MLRKLRIKFVALIMAAVAVVMTTLFAAICAISWQQGLGEVSETLDGVLGAVVERADAAELAEGFFGDDDFGDRRGREIGRHRNERDFLSESGPVAIYLYEDGSFTALSRSGVRVSADALARAASVVPEGQDAEGLLDDFDLAYREEVAGDRSYVAFAEADFLPAWRRLVFVLVLVELAALAAFFGIALLLSRWALRPVERAWSQQRQFVEDAAHDLKTPLTVILANSSILLDEPAMAAPEREKWVRSTQSEARDMRDLVENMLATMGEDEGATPQAGAPAAPSAECAPAADAGGSDAGALPSGSGDVDSALEGAGGERAGAPRCADLSRVVQHEMLQFESVAYERGLRLEGSIGEGLFVAMGRDDARRVVDVLLDNACKYADEGGAVRVAVEAASSLWRGPTAAVRLTVANTGDAVAAEDLPRLFDRFYRADVARTSQAGHGLGLSIAKALVEGAGGTISAQSENGQTTFTVDLPRMA